MGCTLDGIAKGYIADRMAEVLQRHGLHRFVIDAGGDVRACGRNARGGPWVVAVRHPEGGSEFPDIIGLESGAVATSGGYERFFPAGRPFHHIVSPDTGCSPADVTSVSVAAPDCLTADALATALFVLGTDRGLALIDRLPRCAALVLDARGAARPSRRWARRRVRLQEGTPA
jgi:thiamine biosynthesis lipoprotein